MEGKMENIFNMIETNTSAIDIARYMFYKYSFESDRKDIDYSKYLDALGLQKRLYFSQVLALHFFNQELFKEDCEAWKHGPVVSVVYNTYEYDKPSLMTFERDSISAFDTYIVDSIFEITMNIKESWILRNLSHADNGAWKKYYKPNEHGIIIPKECIRSNIPEDFLVLANAYFKEKRRYDKNLVSKEILNLEFLNG